MYKTCLLATMAALACCTSTSTAAADRYVLDTEHTFSTFEYKHWGLSLQRGRFDKNTGSIELNEDARSGKLQISIDTDSINTGSDKFNQVLKSESFFDAQKYPQILFQSSKLIFNEDKLVQVEGELTIRDIKRNVSIDISHFECRFMILYLKRACGANGSTKILRSDYGMGRYAPFVSDEVTLSFSVEAIRE